MAYLLLQHNHPHIRYQGLNPLPLNLNLFTSGSSISIESPVLSFKDGFSILPLTFKFKNEGLEAIKNYSVYISKKITIEEEKSVEEKSVDEKIVLCLYFLVMISIEFLVNGEEGVSKFLSWLDSIEKNKAFEPKDYAYFNNQYKLNN